MLSPPVLGPRVHTCTHPVRGAGAAGSSLPACWSTSSWASRLSIGRSSAAPLSQPLAGFGLFHLHLLASLRELLLNLLQVLMKSRRCYNGCLKKNLTVTLILRSNQPQLASGRRRAAACARAERDALPHHGEGTVCIRHTRALVSADSALFCSKGNGVCLEPQLPSYR